MNVLDLFSGIGGFSLGLERTGGFRTVAFCECEPYAQRVLAKHWPDVPVYPDVRELTATRLAADGIDVSVITAGFPCQDISYAGKGAGLAGERSGLWREVARLVGELRPRYAILENVSALLGRGLGDVLGDLAALGYDAEWHCIPASYIGAPHRRDRWWCVAYPAQLQRNGGDNHARGDSESGGSVPEPRDSGCNADVADADQPRLEGWLGRGVQECSEEWLAGPGGPRWDESEWFAQSGMGRVANGVPARVDRLRCLGNAVVPKVAEIIGRAILAAERARG